MLTQILGLDRSELTYESLVEVLKVDSEGSLFESEQLDYKSKYHTDSLELARDVTAFANRRGGVIVFGVKDGDEAAGRLTHVGLGREATVLNQRLNQATQPLITSVEWIALEGPAEGGQGILLLVVEPSHIAPHAVTEKHRLGFYWRQGREVRAMQEGDIERAYRQRLQSRQATESAIERGRGWVTDDKGCMYVVAAPALSSGHVYGSPGDAVQRFQRVQRLPTVRLYECSIVGKCVRSRIGRLTGTEYRDDDGDGETSEVAVIDRSGLAAVRLPLQDIDWLVRCSGYKDLEPKKVHSDLNHYTSDRALLRGVVMLLVGLRELYREFGVSGGMLLEFGFRSGGATLFTAGFTSSMHGQQRISEEDGSFDLELKVSDLHSAATLGRLVSDIHQDLLAGFDVHMRPAADENGAVSLERLTPDGYQHEPALWESKGLKVRRVQS